MSADGVVLAINSGSSSLKVGCFDRRGSDEVLILTGTADGIGRADGHLRLQSGDGEVLFEEQHVSETQDQALERLAAALDKHLSTKPIAIGHRVVHGGPKLREHQRITPALIDILQDAVHLAPLHIPQSLELIRLSERLYPSVPQFACFDTTFHRSMPDVATHLPIPVRYFSEGVQRYGFHGLSCESVMRRLGPKPPARMVIAHLGNGSSVTAVLNGLSVDTSMGFSPTGGVPMGTRSGDLDPGVLLYVLRKDHLSADALEQFVNHSCGLSGLSGGEADMQRLLSRAASGDPSATLAVQVFCTEIRKTIGSYAALLGGLELLVFTGGIGENSDVVRQQITQTLGFLFDQTSGMKIAVLGAEEEREIAHHSRDLLAKEGRED